MKRFNTADSQSQHFPTFELIITFVLSLSLNVQISPDSLISSEYRERVSNTPLQTRINQMKALVWKRLNVRNFISFQSFHYEIDEHRNEWWHKLNCMHMNIEIPLSMPITQASLCKTFTGEWPPSDVFWLDSLIVWKIPFGHFSLSYLASKRQKC